MSPIGRPVPRNSGRLRSREGSLVARLPAVLVMAAFAGVSSGCIGQHSTVSGQVFIVTQGRENVKLGLVLVSLIDAAEVHQHIETRLARHRADSLAYVEAVDAEVRESRLAIEAAVRKRTELGAVKGRRLSELGAEVEVVQQELATARISFRDADHAYAAAASRGIASANFKVGEEPAPVEHAIRERLRSAVEKAEGKLRELESRRQALVSGRSGPAVPAMPVVNAFPALTGEYLFVGLPAGISAAKTDADGRFELTLPKRGDCFLAASAERTTLMGKEAYYWLVELPASARDGSPVLLSNDNLLLPQQVVKRSE